MISLRQIAFGGGLSIVCAAGLCGQQVGDLNAGATASKSYVVYAAEQQVVTAGKRSVLEMQFRVASGFHVNSHTPKSELLIPTKLSFDPAAGVKEGPLDYPEGTSYSFSFDPRNKLDVYSGPFTVKLPVVAEAGAHTINGVLHYQACDHAACYPPKSLPVQVVFTAK